MKKKIIKIILLIIIIVLGVLLGNFVFHKFQANKYKKMLKDNDATNYKLIEKTIDGETIVKVRDGVLVSENEDTLTWVDSLENKRVLINTKYKTAIITENDNDLNVSSLNNTYINDYFENSNQKFKYLGKEDGFYKIQFTNKENQNITIIYINENTKMVEKVVQISNNIEFVINYEIDKKSVSKKDVEYPDLNDYHVTESVSSNTK